MEVPAPVDINRHAYIGSAYKLDALMVSHVIQLGAQNAARSILPFRKIGKIPNSAPLNVIQEVTMTMYMEKLCRIWVSPLAPGLCTPRLRIIVYPRLHLKYNCSLWIVKVLFARTVDDDKIVGILGIYKF